MRLFSILLLLTAGVSSVIANDNDELAAVVKAYNEAKALGQRADTFIHAQRAYKLAKQQYNEKSDKLVPFTLLFAQASASYKEPIALNLFKQSIQEHLSIYGEKHRALIMPLIDGADEALYRKKYDLAYEWYKKARETLENTNDKSNVDMARIHLGLSRLYFKGGDVKRAKANISLAKNLTQLADDSSYEQKGLTYYWLGQIEREVNNNIEALQSYKNALTYYEKHDPDSRRILTLYKRLVEINDKLGNYQDAVENCLNYEQWNSSHNWLEWGPIYDPEKRLTANYNYKVGQFIAGYERTEECKVTNITIYKTNGITEEEATKLLENAYISPRIKNGKLQSDQYVEQINIDVYAN